MARKFLMPLLVVVMIAAMVVPGCAAGDRFAVTLAVSPAGAGTAIDLTDEGPYEQGTVISIEASPALGWVFAGWSAPAGSFAAPGSARTTFTMPGQRVTMTANFEQPVREGGAWVDEIVISQENDHAKAILKLQEGTVHVYGHGLTNTELLETVDSDPNLDYQMTLGGSRDFMFNVYGPEFPDGDLNPFHSAKVREATQWMIDRDFIVAEILGGLGLPLYTQFSPGAAEATRYAALVAEVEAYYAYDLDKAIDAVADGMVELGAELVDGKWHYNGSPVVVKQLIRLDLAPYPGLGDYFADQLEICGFTVERLYRESRDTWGPFLLQPVEANLWHVYGGGWGMPAVFRTEVHSWRQFNTHQVMVGYPSWEALEPFMSMPEWVEMYDAMMALALTDFADMDERAELVETALWGARRFANNIWSIAITDFIPYRAEVDMALDAAGGVSMQFPFTVHFKDAGGNPVRGGTLHVELPSVLVQNMNPVAGSPMTYDIFVTRELTGDMGLMPHPKTGLNMPQRIERAEVTLKTGLPAGVDSTSPGYWCKLNFEDTIAVPPDAWADWDAENQVWVTAAERQAYDADYTLTANRKSVVYYPADLWDFPLHDGSTLSIADFMMSAIVGWDRGKEDSPIFDPAEQAPVESALKRFKGWQILSEDPLTIAVWSDVYALDAEHAISTMWPGYGTYGEFAPWHTIAIGMLAETDKATAWSSSKSSDLGVEWMDYTKGPTLALLEGYLDTAADDGFIPYAATMADYLPTAEVAERYATLSAWYADKGHFWVSSGPFYLDAVFPIGKIVVVKAHDAYPDPSNKWMFLVP